MYFSVARFLCGCYVCGGPGGDLVEHTVRIDKVDDETKEAVTSIVLIRTHIRQQSF